MKFFFSCLREHARELNFYIDTEKLIFRKNTKQKIKILQIILNFNSISKFNIFHDTLKFQIHSSKSKYLTYISTKMVSLNKDKNANKNYSKHN